MSIFKDTFTKEISGSLDARQKAIEKRSPQSIQYLNTRNAWIRMTSSVNVNGTNELAKQYILQGGILKPDGGLRSGVGGKDNAYSNISPSGQTYLRGVRPMPGINSIDIKSKSAYGSLREVVVQFQCWDIKQLEDLELLYMRPGYTVLVEWGWLPYLKNENTLEYNVTPYDIINQTPAKEDVWTTLYTNANKSGGNYEAMFGFIKNYSWSARADGGYDCTTTIISTGEIIESLKVNYSPLNLAIRKGNVGLFGGILTEENEKRYKKNILAGIFSELYGGVVAQSGIPFVQPQQSAANTTNQIISNASQGSATIDNGQQVTYAGYNFFKRVTTITNTQNQTSTDSLIAPGSESSQIYITLESLVEMLNSKVLLKDRKSKTPLVKLSTKGRAYIGEGNQNLLCLAHPLQLSVDPTICLIGNDAWSNVKSPSSIADKGNDVFDEDFYLRYTDQPVDFSNLINILKGRGDRKEEKKTALINALKGDSRLIRELNRQWAISPNALIESTNGGVFRVTLYRYLSEFGYVFSEDELKNIFGVNLPTIKVSESETEEFKKAKELARTSKIEFEKKKEEIAQQNNKLSNAIGGSQYLKNLESYFYNRDPYLELGIIGKIYVNLQFLYGLSLDNSLQSQIGRAHV
jgi:hypothetical protein